ncbi:hypothetical protein FN846DRAFT_903698 [Sphaerosporella brunnea]|uniref:Uncharacterized protein n=1 Tax=Sphaerosporella brunnea TaxID=1250544 RepID=A0A5J5F6H8_9PEZI|nr:hypothetical protein FN846DRAFT_903698 [Sphaerosporella brunnea]
MTPIMLSRIGCEQTARRQLRKAPTGGSLPAIETKTITTDAWFNKAIELAVKLGVDTVDIEQPALHSLHILLKKKVDETLTVQQKQINAAAKKLAAQMGLAAANTRVDAADQEMDVAEIRPEGAILEASAAHTLVDAPDQVMAAAELRTEGATLEALAGQTRSVAADHGTQLIKHRTDGARREGDTGDLRYKAAKAEEEIVALRRHAAKKEDEAASIRFQREKQEEELVAVRFEREKVRLAKETLLLEQAAAGGSGRSSSAVSSAAASCRPGWVPPFAGPGYESRAGHRLARSVTAPGRSTGQDRGAAAHDAVRPQHSRLEALRISGDPMSNPVRNSSR